MKQFDFKPRKFERPNPSKFKYRSDFTIRRPGIPDPVVKPLAGKFLAFEDPINTLTSIQKNENFDIEDRLLARLQMSKMLTNTPGQNNLLLFNEYLV